MRFSSFSVLAASISTAAAVSQGFNYGATKSDGTFNYQSDFESLFKSAQGLEGTNGGFTSARLYTMIQGGSSTNEPTEAIPAAISTGTTLLLGLWASGGQGPFSAELTALKSAIEQYGDDFAKLVVGISIGSEDIYRNSAVGKAADAGVGADALTVSGYIQQARAVIEGTSLANVLMGHVDTWTGWAQSGDPNIDLLIGNSSFIGVDAYPYFQYQDENSIENAKSLFETALATTESVVGDKPLWITETGWAVSGKTQGEGVASLANSKTYYDEVGCPRFGNVNIWWYTLQDSNPVTPNPSFGLIGSDYTTTPLFDLSCSNTTSSSSSSSSSSSASATSTKASSSSATKAPSTKSGAATTGSSSTLSAVVSSATIPSASGNGTVVTPIATATGTGSSSIPTGVPGSNETVSTSGLTSVPSGTTSGSTPIATGAASALSISFISAIAGLIVAIAAL